MPNYIILRLTPATAVAPGTFSGYLTGLTVKAYDVSYDNPDGAGVPAAIPVTAASETGTTVTLQGNFAAVTKGDPIRVKGVGAGYDGVFVCTGATASSLTYPVSASNLPAKSAGGAVQPHVIGVAQYNKPTPKSGNNPPFFTYPPGTGIAQHTDPAQPKKFVSVATAVIPVPAGIPEYVSPAVQIEFDRGNQAPIVDPNIYYEVALLNAGTAPTPGQYQGLPAAAVGAYVTLPAPPSITSAPALQVSNNGNPPKFANLMTAVNAVLSKDPGGAVTLADLSVEQCRTIAHEIVYGPQPALPAASATLENMFTNPPNDGSSTNANEQSRSRFQGDLTTYYATNNATADQLTKFVFALVAAAWCERQSQQATSAIVDFPVNPNGSAQTNAVVKEAEVIFTGALGIDVPAEYFYALTAQMPEQIAPARRFQAVTRADQQHNLDQLTDAVNAGWISVRPMNPAQAARALAALGVPASSSTPTCAIASVAPIWTDWLAYPALANWKAYQAGGDVAGFWPAEAANHAGAFLDLVLCVLTQAYVDTSSGTSLAAAIKANLLINGTTHIASVADIVHTSTTDWQNFFAPLPAKIVLLPLLPPFTLPGTPDARVDAFIRRVRTFFDIAAALPAINATTAPALPSLGLPNVDPIRSTLAQFGSLSFGAHALTAAELAALAHAAWVALPGDAAAQAWAVQTIHTINDLAVMVNLPHDPAKGFSLVEALFARGFTSSEDVLDLAPADFQQALAGTVAYDSAAAIYAAAGTPHSFPEPGAQQFVPVNPGSLTDCVPPPCLSPSGPIAYLQDMLQVTESSTCENWLPASVTLALTRDVPNRKDLTVSSTAGVVVGMRVTGPKIPPNTTVVAVTPPSTVTLSQAVTLNSGTSVTLGMTKTLGSVIGQRRGPLGNLATSEANCDTPIPLIDMVNECLEHMAATVPPNGSGAVHDTAGEMLAGHKLCADECCTAEEKEDDAASHDPATMFAALPEYATPATPALSAAGGPARPAAYDILKSDFSACCLPYSQGLDVSRTYLEHFRTCRYEEMRTFRKCITEFVLDPANPPKGFQPHLWRYPVRIDTAIEYLGITPEEYVMLFGGAWPQPCAAGPAAGQRPAPRHLRPWELYGFAVEHEKSWTEIVVQLPEFLRRTCLSYCEFFDLWNWGPVKFANGGDVEGHFPQCEPCCLEKLWIKFPRGQELSLGALAVFIRLWHKLKHLCGGGYSFAQLSDICAVLELFQGNAVNPDFIRRLAAFQVLRDQFALPLADEHAHVAANATGADRTHLLSLWTGTGHKWDWAVERLIAGIAHHAECRHKCAARGPEFLKLLAANLDPLSRLAGFDPATATDTWHAAPTHTLRFAEVLTKIYASNFTIGEIFFLFTADDHLDGDDPLPLQSGNEALDSPLGLPDDEHEHSLWRLRRKLLEAELCEDDLRHWTWPRIESTLQHELGFAAADALAFGEHFFPDVLERAGHPVGASQRRFLSALAASNTSAPMWNAPPEGPFHYDASSGNLWAQLPLSDAAMLGQLTRVNSLNQFEQPAVQDLYFQPRAMLAPFALLFADFARAQRCLIEQHDERERWEYFRRQFALCDARLRIIAEHLAAHVAAATGQECPEGTRTALLLLKNLFADENAAPVGWENDSGQVPTVTWSAPSGGAFAALLGLTGTGLVGEFTPEGGSLAWREVTGPMSLFGRERDRENCPVPTILPALGLVAAAKDAPFVTIRNGLAMQDATGEWLGGAQGFEVRWSGALLVEREGEYTFKVGAPEGAEPSEHRKWRVTLKRGQKTWIVLRHRWRREKNCHDACLPLKCGAYELTIEFAQARDLDEEAACRQHTGFELRYCGPDTCGELIAIPHDRLFAIRKDAPLNANISGLSPAAKDFLHNHYYSSWRDIRRTYLRAFEALLFAHRFALSAEARAGGQSELGYMRAHADKFAGVSYYRNGPFVRHAANFDFNFLPVLDDYYPPAADSRTDPSLRREAALFDWWERIFDYDCARKEVRHHCGRHLWLLFEEAADKQPADATSLLRHMGADARHWRSDLHFFQDQTAPVYAVTARDLEDDRWTIRAWRADLWIRSLLRCFRAKDITVARPDLWASDYPSLLLPGESETGNANLTNFLCDGCLENGAPRLYDDLRRLNDGLRERGRHALISHLCGANGLFKTPRELTDQLLIDVETGLCERASRIEEAITAVQTFVQRARIGLEKGWAIAPQFAHMWDARFASYHVWQACKRRELYKENWIDWDELEKAKKIESFRFMDEELRRVTLTLAAPGGVDYWPRQGLPPSGSPSLLQERAPAAMRLLPAPRQGLDLLTTPQRDARPSWLAMLPAKASSGSSTSGAKPIALPLWLESAIRLNAPFVRVQAAGYPPASTKFEPRKSHARNASGEEACVDCCAECGCRHPAHVDEYYFWLVDAKQFDPHSQPVYDNFDAQQNSYYDHNSQISAPWHDPTQLPNLLQWPAQKMVRLAWCRVHNGEFMQRRVSTRGIVLPPGAVPDLVCKGRVGDSLYFDVTYGSATPSTPPGFRYDMADDLAHLADPLTVPAPSSSFPGGLPAYPYFAYFTPGARLFQWSSYSPTIAVAHALRAHCRYEAALKWYDLYYDPLARDNTWARCADHRGANGGPAGSIATPPAPGGAVPSVPVPTTSACCDSTEVSCRVARDRSVLLQYVDTLLDWGDALMRRDSPEHFQQARVIYDSARTILGEPPHKVLNPDAVQQTVATFRPLFASINPRLMRLYDRVDDRMALIHRCLDNHRLRPARERHDGQYWGNEPMRGEWHADRCCGEDDWCEPHSPYRFQFLIAKAKELANQVRELGGALLAAFEKGDGEFLASLRAGYERELASLSREIRQDQWRDSDRQVETLQKTKESDQASRSYYANLIANGLISNETGYVNQTNVALAERTASNIFEGIAETMTLIPDVWAGTTGVTTQAPVGTKLAGLFKTVARVLNVLADNASTTASLDLTEAGWDRRLQDWIHQVTILDIQIEQVELQILGAQRRRDQALRELNNQQRQIENATEVMNFLRDKFSNHAVYLYLQKETADLHCRMYELAVAAARQAERAFHFERGHHAREFVSCRGWNDLHEGLLAGERLQVSLAHMDKAYCDHNRREYELTKHVSLRLHAPLQFLRLKLTGRCEIELPESLFDRDYPGHYMRRIKNATVNIPVVSGPYNNVNCRLTLRGSATRVDPLLSLAPAQCCHTCESGDGYEACLHDPRMHRQYAAAEAIVTSSGQNDSGLFELNLHDDRYLPFEYRGAISKWRIELPPEDNYFDLGSVSDVILNLSYTAREGGERLREAARAAAEKSLPGAGWCLFDVPHDFPDAWELFKRKHENGGARDLNLSFSRQLFPFLPGHRELCIEKMALLFDACEAPEHDCGGECACVAEKRRACWRVEFDDNRDDCDDAVVRCAASEDWPNLYYGVADTRIGPLGRNSSRSQLRLGIPCEAGGLSELYLLCRYQVMPRHRERMVSDASRLPGYENSMRLTVRDGAPL
jgi:Tc toxin complex TcA C-terminal TcB-binding domain